MGKTAFAGPVYGAKSLLWSLGPVLGAQNTSTAAAFVNASRTVPPYEDWYITEVGMACSTCSSSPQSFILKSEGGSTTIPPRPNVGSTISQTISSFSGAAANSTTIGFTLNTVTATPGEYEGLWVPAGSTLRFVSSGASAPAGLQLQVHGYVRFIDSTRAS